MIAIIFFLNLYLLSANALAQIRDTLFDVPVSNHGARIRLISRLKTIGEDLIIKNPSEVGGLKSPEYAKFSIHGKMPLLVTGDGFSVVESDSIARFLLDKYRDLPPSFTPRNIYERSLSEQITRVHDVYISPIQGCMYKAPGTPFSIYGTDRKAALYELKRQLFGIENMLPSIDNCAPEGADRTYLCGSEVSLADVTLYPTIVFCVYMLPKFFQWSLTDFLGPRLLKWYNTMSDQKEEFKQVNTEIITVLEGWRERGRWDPILEEMKDKAATEGATSKS